MRILAVETSCDETAVSIIEARVGIDGRPPDKIKVLSNLVSSQIKLHAKFGGVVPNLARREHEKNLTHILIKALEEAKMLNSKLKSQKSKLQVKSKKFDAINSLLEREPILLKNFLKHILRIKKPDIDCIAVTFGPGLAPALWAGVNFVKALGALWEMPVVPINHMEGHLWSALLRPKNPKHEVLNHKQIRSSKLQIQNGLEFRVSDLEFPAIALLVSGGHTELVLAKSFRKKRVVGETLDDAVGEAFDKVARMLGLPFPGGPEISRLAEGGDPDAIDFPRPLIEARNFDFSFSGLKTSVLYYLRDNQKAKKEDVAASFEKAAVEVLVNKTCRAAESFGARTVLLGGGVAANKRLRYELGRGVKKVSSFIQYLAPESFLTGDNALMIAFTALISGKQANLKNIKAESSVRL